MIFNSFNQYLEFNNKIEKIELIVANLNISNQAFDQIEFYLKNKIFRRNAICSKEKKIAQTNFLILQEAFQILFINIAINQIILFIILIKMLSGSEKKSSINNFSSNESEGAKEQEIKTQEVSENEQSDNKNNL